MKEIIIIILPALAGFAGVYFTQRHAVKQQTLKVKQDILTKEYYELRDMYVNIIESFEQRFSNTVNKVNQSTLNVDKEALGTSKLLLFATREISDQTTLANRKSMQWEWYEVGKEIFFENNGESMKYRIVKPEFEKSNKMLLEARAEKDKLIKMMQDHIKLVRDQLDQ